MKKISILLFLLTAFVFAKAQYPIQQSVANAPNTIGRTNAFRANDGFVNGVFTDTTAANLKQIKAYPGAQIFTTLDSSFWLRNPPATRWLKANAAAGSISSFTFITDSSLVICYADGSCDTIPINNFVEIVNEIVNNFIDSSITLLNDSTLIICNAAGSCDTIDLGTTNTYNFYIDSTGQTFVVTCDTLQTICVAAVNFGGDSCYQQQVCDTIPIGSLARDWHQNGLTQIPLPSGRLIELGQSSSGEGYGNLVHDTWLYTNFAQFNIIGRPYPRPPLHVEQQQWIQESPAIASWKHLMTNASPSDIDYYNNVNMTFLYTRPFVPMTQGTLAGDTVGYMFDRVGYIIGVNTPGARYALSYENILSKQSGVMLHTLDTANVDAVTVFGNQQPDPLNFAINPPTNTTLLNSRIAVFKTTGQVQFPEYLTINSFPGTAEGLIGFDASGNLITTTGVAGSTTTILNDSTIEVCTGGFCDTLVFSDVDAQNVFVINDSTLLVCNVTNTVCDTVNIPQGFAFFDRGFFDPNQASIGATVHNANSNDFSLVSADEILLGANTRTYIQGRLEEDMGVSVAAANDLTLGSDGNLFTITGATQINAITTANWQAGSKVWFIFSGAPLVKNATAGGAGTATILLAGRVDFQAAAGDILYLGYNGTNWYEINRALASGTGITGITADNGLTANTATNVQWGGTLLQNTTINTAGFTSTWTGSNSGYAILVNNSGSGSGISSVISGGGSNAAIFGQTTSAIGIYGDATDGIAVEGNATTGIPGIFIASPSSTNTIQNTLTLSRFTTGTAANSIGQSIDMNNETTTGNGRLSNQFVSKWVDATDASRISQMDIIGVGTAITNTIASFYGGGVVGIGISTAYTATRLNVVDNTVAGASIVDITSTSTAAASNLQKGINVLLSGTNATATQTTYGIFANNTHAGTGSSNIGIQGSASGGLTVNFGVLGVTSSNVGISAGVYALNTSTGYGLLAETSTSGTAGQGNTASGIGFQGSASSSGTGVRGNSSSGNGVQAYSITGTPLLVFTEPSSTNTVIPLIDVYRRSSSTAADGIGLSFDLKINTNTTADVLAAQMITKWITATHASRTSSTIFNNVLAGTTVESLVLAGDGSVKLRPITATAASAITPAEGQIVFTSDTNGTFTSIGFWGYQGGAWVKM